MKTLRTKLKPIPKFKNEDEERDFWDTHSALDYFDFDHPVKLDLSHLRPTVKPVTVRLPTILTDNLRTLANRRDVPYQSLLKIYLAQKVEEEMRKLRK